MSSQTSSTITAVRPVLRKLFGLCLHALRRVPRNRSGPNRQGFRQSGKPIKPVPSRFVPDTSRGSLTESKILGQPFYNAVVVATGKTARPGGFFHLVQEKAAKPIVLRTLIKLLIKMYRPPLSKKDPEMV